jgi:hypothetical protein
LSLGATLLAASGYASAQDLQLKRGVSVDFWVERLQVDEILARPDLLSPYPD